MKGPVDYFKPSIQSQKGLQVFIFDRQSANALFKFDGMPESFLRLFEPARDAGVARD